MNWTTDTYEHSSGDFRKIVTAEHGDVWIICVNSAGYFDEPKLIPKDSSWREGTDELHRIFDSEEEARAEYERL